MAETSSPKRTYAGIPEEFATLEKSKVVILPVPYDGTSTWIKGADKGPDAFLEASKNMEVYDIETDSEVFRHGVHLLDDLGPFAGPEHMAECVEKEVQRWIDKDKLVTTIGGEHSVSIGALRAFRKKYSELTVLQVDAHTDLRPTYEGSACNHACALYESSQESNLIQVGIRSMDVSEKQYMNLEKTFFAHDVATALDDGWIDQVASACTENVYITIDLDGFDPSILPATGTPEPGGLGYYQVLRMLRKVFETKNVVGFDIVELCPNQNDPSSDFVMAKLYYKMLSYKYCLS